MSSDRDHESYATDEDADDSDAFSDSDTDVDVVDEHSHYCEYDYDESDGDYVDDDSGIIESTEEPATKVKDASRRAPPSRRKGTCSWAKPRRRCYRVDTSGSVKRGKEGGYGAIIRDSDGNFVAAASGVSDKLSVLYNKVLGVKLGLELARDLKLEDIEVATTSRFISFLVSGQRKPYEEDAATVGPVLAEIFALKVYFDLVDYFPSFRGCNQAADYISKLFQENNEIKPESHTRLLQIMNDDSAGVRYPCLF